MIGGRRCIVKEQNDHQPSRDMESVTGEISPITKKKIAPSQRDNDTSRMVVQLAFPAETGETPGVAYMVESIARAVARTAPREGDADANLTEERMAAAKQVQELATTESPDGPPRAVLALSGLVHDFLRMRERATLLSSMSANVYSTLNRNEHKLLEVQGGFDRLLGIIAHASVDADALTQKLLTDRHAQIADRVRAAEVILSHSVTAVPFPNEGVEQLHCELLDAQHYAASLNRELELRTFECERLNNELAKAQVAISVAELGAAQASGSERRLRKIVGESTTIARREAELALQAELAAMKQELAQLHKKLSY
jgi:hypothetical protein